MESFIPPIEVQANARRALEVRASKPESQRGMLAVGLGRARDLSSGRPVSLDIIRRMNSFFARHAVDKKGETWEDMGPGWQAWMGWGGDAGQRWARRILSRYEQRVANVRSGGKIGKAGPNDPQNAPPPGNQPPPPGNQPPPQGNPPQGGPPQNQQGQPNQSSDPKLVEIAPGRFRDENTGKIFNRENTVPDDKQTKQNELDTVKYLESSGLKEAHKALMSLAIDATESVNQDTKNRLYRAGLVDITPSGVNVTPFGQFFLNIVQSNKDITEKEQMMKMTLYGAELYRKRKSGIATPPSANPKPKSPAPYLERNDGVSYLQRSEGVNDTLRKSLASFNDDVEGNGMALGQIRAMRDKLEHLATLMTQEKIGLEAWQKSKVTSASDDITAVHDAIAYDDDAVQKMTIEKSQKTGTEQSKEKRTLTAKTETPNFLKFASFEKASPEQRVVVGYASSERVDGQNDVVDSEALSQALGDYMQWANLREMHQPKAVGKVLSATPVRGTIQLKDGSKLTNPLRIVAQIIDNETWEKVKTGVLKGFSIGGKVLQALTQKMNGKEVRRITGLQLHEISLVDRPANPDARIILMKRDDSTSTDEAAVAKVAKTATISKASQTDPSKLLPQMQQLRNQAEIEGDLEQAERYNEIISLMLEAMGVIPQGTTRETGEIESGEQPNANPLNNQQNDEEQMGDFANPGMGVPPGMPDNMMSMDQVYAYNPSFQNTSNVAYAQLADDLQKAGRMLSKSTEGQLDQIMQAVQFIVQQVQALKSANAPAPQGQSPQGAPGDPNAVPEQQPGMPDLSAVPTSESPLPAESPQPNVQSQLVPQQPTSSMAPSPETMAMLRGIGNPVLAANQKTGDLKKGDVDLESIEREIRAMEQMTENSAPPMESMEGSPAVEKAETTETAATTTSFDIDSIAKSLSNVIAQQLVDINKQMEQMHTVAKEQNASLFATVNPLTEAINETKAAIAPLVEKVASLEPLTEKIDALATRMDALENSPAPGNSPVLRGTAVSKALGGSAAELASGKGANELETIYKMIDEAKDPIVRTKLREQAAFLESKNLFRRN